MKLNQYNRRKKCNQIGAFMSEYNPSHHKMPRSRSRSVRQVSDAFIVLTRPKPLYVPKTIKFIRGPMPKNRQIVMDENCWVTIPETLSQILTQENSTIMEYRGSHQIPPTPQTSAFAFFSALEVHCFDPQNPQKTEMARAFCNSVASLFAKNVVQFLLYDSESHRADTIKMDPLKNTPAIFVLRFLYFLPSLLKDEDPTTELSKSLQDFLATLANFATKVADTLFILPTSIHKISTSIPSHGHKSASKSDSRGVIRLGSGH